MYSRTPEDEEQNSCLYAHSCNILGDRTLQFNICGVYEGLPIYTTVAFKKGRGKKEDNCIRKVIRN